MFHQEPVQIYKRSKQETQEIVSRINSKRFSQMFQARSFGFQLQTQFKQSMKRNMKKYKTDLITFRKWQNQKKRTEPLKTYPFFQPVRTTKRVQTEKLEDPNEKVIEVNEQQAEINHQQKESDKQVMLNGQQSKQVELSKGKANNLIFLPELESYVKDLEYEKNIFVKKHRYIIIQIIVLGLMRRRNGKLLDALDILLQAQMYFDDNRYQIIRLRAIWLELIAKLYFEIKKQMQIDEHRIKNRQKNPKISGFKIKNQTKRQSTLIIKSMASRKIFMNRFSHTLKKMKLVYESTYLKEARNYQNAEFVSKMNVKILSRLNQNFVICYPEPKKIFETIKEVNNYYLVIVNRDQQNNFFPYYFPPTLASIMKKEDYLNRISRINSILIPETKCYDYNSTVSLMFEWLLGLNVVFLLGVCLVTFLGRSDVDEQSKKNSQRLCLLLVFCLIIFISVLIQCSHSNIKDITQVYSQIQKELYSWQESYQQDTIAIKLNQTINFIIFSIPFIGDQEEKQSSLYSDSQQEVKVPPSSPSATSINSPQGYSQQPSQSLSLKLQLAGSIKEADPIKEQDEIKEQDSIKQDLIKDSKILEQQNNKYESESFEKQSSDFQYLRSSFNSQNKSG